MATRGKQGISKPNKKYLLTAMVALSNNPEPRTTHQALKDDKWRKTLTEEINAQVKNHTWDLVPPQPANVTIVGCRWIFTTKYNPDGSISKYKA